MKKNPNRENLITPEYALTVLEKYDWRIHRESNSQAITSISIANNDTSQNMWYVNMFVYKGEGNCCLTFYIGGDIVSAFILEREKDDRKFLAKLFGNNAYMIDQDDPLYVKFFEIVDYIKYEAERSKSEAISSRLAKEFP